MFGLDLLAKVVGGEPAAIQGGDCLRRYRRATCRACVEKCPIGIVHLNGKAPRIAGDCRGCGVCVSVCPSGAFSLDATARDGLAAATRTAGPLDVACTLGQARAGGAKVPCLGYLSAGALLALGAGQRPVRLHVAGCAACSLGSARDLIRETAARANALVEAFALPPTVQLVGAQAPAPPRSEPAGCSRRELFARLGGRGTQAGTTAVAAWQERLPFVGAARAAAHLPDHRGQLLSVQLKRLAGKTQGHDQYQDLLPMRRPLAGDGCDLCGLCAATCPSGALAKVDAGSTVQLRWNAAICWSCGLCEDVCPSGALRYGEGVPIAAFVAIAVTILASGVAADCSACGRCFVHRRGENVCPRCREDRRRGVAEATPFGLGRPHWSGAPGTSRAIQGGNGQ